MKVLLSIKPEFANSILDGDKLFEFRKQNFKQKVETVLIYATKPIGMVIGEFDILEIIEDHPKDLWEMTEAGAGISREFFDDYYSSHNKAFAIRVKNPRRYDEPLNLADVNRSGIAPQSFQYI